MSLEFNKLAASVLTAGIAFMGAGIIAEQIIHPKRLHSPAIAVGGAPTQQAAAPAAPAAPAVEPIAPLLAAANADTGRALAQRVCASCHSFNEGGRAGVGPNLYGIVGAKHAGQAGFNYSAANRAMGEKPWTEEEINQFLAGPARYMPGTRMAFAGVSSAPQRADIIAFLRSISPNAPPPR
jgi:cytochrome c